jgi:hypothetical protein
MAADAAVSSYLRRLERLGRKFPAFLPYIEANNQSTTYLKRVKKLAPAFPALRSFLNKIKNHDQGQKILYDEFEKQHPERPIPGRCTLLSFKHESVEAEKFFTLFDLEAKLTSERDPDVCRLWILEDLEQLWVDVLGSHLGVDPLVFSEQMNTWNFTDSVSVPTRNCSFDGGAMEVIHFEVL